MTPDDVRQLSGREEKSLYHKLLPENALPWLPVAVTSTLQTRILSHSQPIRIDFPNQTLEERVKNRFGKWQNEILAATDSQGAPLFDTQQRKAVEDLIKAAGYRLRTELTSIASSISRDPENFSPQAEAPLIFPLGSSAKTEDLTLYCYIRDFILAKAPEMRSCFALPVTNLAKADQIETFKKRSQAYDYIPAVMRNAEFLCKEYTDQSAIDRDEFLIFLGNIEINHFMVRNIMPEERRRSVKFALEFVLHKWRDAFQSNFGVPFVKDQICREFLKAFDVIEKDWKGTGGGPNENKIIFQYVREILSASGPLCKEIVARMATDEEKRVARVVAGTVTKIDYAVENPAAMELERSPKYEKYKKQFPIFYKAAEMAADDLVRQLSPNLEVFRKPLGIGQNTRLTEDLVKAFLITNFAELINEIFTDLSETGSFGDVYEKYIAETKNPYSVSQQAFHVLDAKLRKILDGHEDVPTSSISDELRQVFYKPFFEILDANRGKLAEQFGWGYQQRTAVKAPRLKAQIKDETAADTDLDYTSPMGDVELRDAIAAYENAALPNAVLDNSNIIQTDGGMEANNFVMNTLDTEDAEAGRARTDIVVCKPFYGPLYASCKRRARLREVELDAGDDFKLTAEALRKVLEKDPKKVRYILLSDPNNPTGKLLDPDELSKIIELCEQYGIYLIIDEVGRVFADKEELNKRPVNVNSNMLIRTRSLSKTHTLAGLKMGYIVANDNKIADSIATQITLDKGSPAKTNIKLFKYIVSFERIRLLVEGVTAKSGEVLDRELKAAFPDVDQGKLKRQYKDYIEDVSKNEKLITAQRRMVVEAFRGHPLVEKVVVPDALYNVVVKFKCPMDGWNFFKELLEETGVVITPGVCMGLGNEEVWTRITFANDPKVNEDGIGKIFKFLEKKAAEFI